MLPLFSIVFGDFTNAFGSYIPPCFGFSLASAMSSDEFNRIVSNIALKFVYLGIGAWQGSEACW